MTAKQSAGLLSTSSGVLFGPALAPMTPTRNLITEASMYGGSKDHLVWRLVDSRQDRSYGLFSVRINRSRSPRTGNIHEFQVLDSPDWVAVIPVTSADELVMVRQYRHGTASLSLEPPGGLVKHGSTPEQSGREELEEETGYQAAGFELLGCMDPMPALFTNRYFVFLARDAVPTGCLNPDETEDVETVLVPVARVKEMIRSGEISSSVMIAALHLYFDHRDRGRNE